MALAETYAVERSVGELRLYTNAAMAENLTFYRRLGYRETDRRTDAGFERVFFSKRLDRRQCRTRKTTSTRPSTATAATQPRARPPRGE